MNKAKRYSPEVRERAIRPQPTSSLLLVYAPLPLRASGRRLSTPPLVSIVPARRLT